MFETATDATPSPQERRREHTHAEILAAAWEMARVQGLPGISMRALARQVGLKAPTLYAYFDSKHAIYDAMFRQGYEELLTRLRAHAAPDPADPHGGLAERFRAFFEFCVEDPTRYQLLFQRVVPDFEPTDESYALAVEVLDQTRRELTELGLDDPEALDLWTAIATGLTDQQISNDPGGDRWARLIDRAVAMYLDHLDIH